ncbi:hypothetical protein BCR42DRAFT_416550 [Absidia repens]|uniref:Zn(2)-C6 fungal-type domain-containing protein n=1 Tax=Absidia repens TaxID=90262 RepID=A0A1X2IET3_9FUNG|nr:hypothetical protein BCR42DRAFT_416550 [Absidia repens]
MAIDEPQMSTTTAEPRKKRAKIVSACGECRRRKTKCNGELPCRSCHKADVSCVYPVISHAEDKRNHLSKAALEAIEDRLKAIEDMLHTILRSQTVVAELPAAAVNQFLHSKDLTSPPSPPPTFSSAALPRAALYNHIQQSSSISTSSSASSFVALPPTTAQQQQSLSYTSSLPSPKQQQHQKPIITASSPEVRLPSIHDLSVHLVYSSPPLGEIKQETKDVTAATDLLPPPLGYSSYYTRNNCRYETSSDLPMDENILASNKKRKRS